MIGAKKETNALWISSGTRGPMTANDVGALITQITRETLGIAISPHLFRTADATTAADAKGDMPHLASALLGHTNPHMTEVNYNRATSLNAANEYAAIIEKHYGSRAADS